MPNKTTHVTPAAKGRTPKHSDTSGTTPEAMIAASTEAAATTCAAMQTIAQAGLVVYRDAISDGVTPPRIAELAVIGSVVVSLSDLMRFVIKQSSELTTQTD